jgi:hypothetical protein
MGCGASKSSDEAVLPQSVSNKTEPESLSGPPLKISGSHEIAGESKVGDQTVEDTSLSKDIDSDKSNHQSSLSPSILNSICPGAGKATAALESENQSVKSDTAAKEHERWEIKKLSTIIWKSYTNGELKRLMQPVDSDPVPARGSIFLSFVGDICDATELKKVLEDDHHYEVFMSDAITEPDEMQQKIRYVPASLPPTIHSALPSPQPPPPTSPLLIALPHKPSPA